MMKILAFAVAITLSTIVTQGTAQAGLAPVDGTVKWIELTYYPGRIDFGLDGIPPAFCPDGRFFWQNGDYENMSAILNALMSSLLSKSKIEAYFSVDDSGQGDCIAEFLYMKAE